MFNSTVIYAVIAYFLTRERTTGTFEAALHRPSVIPLYAAGLLLFLIGLFGFGGLKERDPQRGLIVRLALFEACAITGLLAAIFENDWRLYVPAWIVAAIGQLREWPSE